MKKDNHSQDAFSNTLIGRKVWFVYCGVTTGSVIDVHFTPLCLRDRPLSNPQINEQARLYQGEVSLMVQSSWRLVFGDQILAGSGDAFDDATTVFAILNTLVDDQVIRVEHPMAPLLDCVVSFESGHSLHIFCDRRRSDLDDYTLFVDIDPTSVAGGRLMGDER